ncbi:MAG TPA: LacI family DNA-binding transcriptional regulator, partial [Phycisphaerae bacterium]|nr:LacI family DNA-binding transcriptional regulator [Phycisphaerae bacterium]HPP29225.1 LacI family DNA-binding transcriptional regulator [Phycisphaerae bacterium]
MDKAKRPRRSRTTMAEIAARAGVSRATVSIILSSGDQEITRFKPETVARVRQIAESMGYQANLMALSLRNPHPSFFGLILRGVAAAESISWHHQAFEGQ